MTITTAAEMREAAARDAAVVAARTGRRGGCEGADDMTWQPIETAPKDDAPVLLTCIFQGTQMWTAQATWGTASPGYTHCASYSGWMAELPNLCDPTKRSKGYSSPCGMLGDVISFEAFAPTHWMPLPPPPTDAQKEPTT